MKALASDKGDRVTDNGRLLIHTVSGNSRCGSFCLLTTPHEPPPQQQHLARRGVRSADLSMPGSLSSTWLRYLSYDEALLQFSAWALAYSSSSHRLFIPKKDRFKESIIVQGELTTNLSYRCELPMLDFHRQLSQEPETAQTKATPDSQS